MRFSPSLRSVLSRSEGTKGSRRRRRKESQPEARRRLVLERLEDRTLPSSLFQEFTVTQGSQPDGITAGPDGALWFGEVGANKIGRITTAGVLTEFTVPNIVATSKPIFDVNGNCWFSDWVPTSGLNTITEMTQAGQVLQQITVPDYPHGGALGWAVALAVGPDGNIWFTEPWYNPTIGRVNQDGTITQFPLPFPAAGLTIGPDGNFWIAATSTNYIGHVGSNGATQAFAIPDPAVRGLTSAPDGNLWMTAASNGPPANEILRVNSGGLVTGRFPLPTPNSGAYDMTTGLDGGLWFTEFANQIGRISFADGSITEFPIPTPNSGTNTITLGPDGNIWFTESSANKIGEVVLLNNTLPNTLTVTNSLDDGSAGSLRHCIIQANADAALGNNATVNFDSSLSGQTITLTQGELDLTATRGTITVDGSSLSTPVTINGTPLSPLAPTRVFFVGSGVNATISGLTIANGWSADRGGGIYNRGGTLTVQNCTLSGNSARYEGGAIYNTGTITVTGAHITANQSTYGGGISSDIFNYGDHPTITITDSTFDYNQASYQGGGIFNFGTLNVVDSSLNYNSARQGGAILNEGHATITATSMGLTNLVGNTADIGGGIANNFGAIDISNINLIRNVAGGAGGAIWNAYQQATLSVTGSNLSDNSAGSGGGIANFSATATISGTILQNNAATVSDGGAIWNTWDPGSGPGTTVTIVGSTVTNNTAIGLGGGIFNGVGYSLHSTVTVSACAVSQNTASAGGGISDSGYLKVDSNSVITNNQALTGVDIQVYWSAGALADFYNSAVGNLYDVGVVHIHDTSIGSLGIAFNFVELTFYASDTSFAQSAADVIGQTVAPIGFDGSPVPITITLNLVQGTYQDLTLSTQANVTLIVNGVNGSVGTVNGTTVVGNSPALVVTAGNILVENIEFTTSTDAPTVLVAGGHLTLRNNIIQESTGYNDAAILVTGGSLDLGTAASPGGNTINVNGAGQSVVITGPFLVTAVGNTFQVNGAAVASPEVTVAVTSSANPSVLNQPVSFTANVSTPTSGSATPTGNVTFQDLATGTTLGVRSLSGGSAILTVSSLPVNIHTIAAIYSGDSNYITSSTTLVQQVLYRFGGFLAPLNSNLAFGLNRVIPIKFQLTDYNGIPVSGLSAVTSLQVLNNRGTNVLTNSGSTALRYDPTSNQFVANWQTKGLSAGTYTVIVALADGTTYTKTIQLSKPGSAAGLMVNGSATTAATGALLGGDITLYVDNTNGDLTADELARIQDAVTAADAVTEP
jgi:streptogramin lyase